MSGDKPKEKKEIEPGYTNAFWNLLKPLTVTKALQGSAEYVAIEVLVGQTIRRVMSAPYNIAESLELHSYSIPFLGQMNFGDPYKPLNYDKKAKFEIVEEMTEGAKAIPAAIVGYIAMRLRRDGMKIPSFANRDFVYMMVGKVLSRPLTQFVYTSLPEDFQIALEVLNELANRQKAVIDNEKAQTKAKEKQRRTI